MRLMADVTDGDEDAMEIMEKKFGRLEDAWNEISKKLGTKNPEPRQIAMLMKTRTGNSPESMFDMLKKQEGRGATAEETGMTQTAKSMIGVEPERKKKKKKKEKEFEL